MKPIKTIIALVASGIIIIFAIPIALIILVYAFAQTIADDMLKTLKLWVGKD